MDMEMETDNTWAWTWTWNWGTFDEYLIQRNSPYSAFRIASDQGRTQGGCTGCTCIPPPSPA